MKTYKEYDDSIVFEDLYFVVIDLQKDIFVFRAYVTSAATAVLESIELIDNCLGYLNFEKICKLINLTIGMEIHNQLMSDICDGCRQGKYTIDFYHNTTF